MAALGDTHILGEDLNRRVPLIGPGLCELAEDLLTGAIDVCSIEGGETGCGMSPELAINAVENLTSMAASQRPATLRKEGPGTLTCLAPRGETNALWRLLQGIACAASSGSMNQQVWLDLCTSTLHDNASEEPMGDLYLLGASICNCWVIQSRPRSHDASHPSLCFLHDLGIYIFRTVSGSASNALKRKK